MDKIPAISFGLVITVVSLLAGGLYAWLLPSLVPMTPVPATVMVFPSHSPAVVPSPSSLPNRLSLSVPFIVQAPDGLWEESLFQDGCEEAALLTVWHWLQGTALTNKEAGQAIRDVSAFEDATYGPAADRSAQDTMQLMKDYFKYASVRVEYNITAQTIKKALAGGSIVITPMNGRLLHNPFYTPPGPDRHMIVIIGYDDTTNQFITNDPGTIHGLNYHYSQDAYMAAIRDYPTGNHLPIPARVTAMIIIGPYICEIPCTGQGISPPPKCGAPC